MIRLPALSDLTEGLGNSLERFWAHTYDGKSAGLFRITFGAVVLYTASLNWVNADRYYGADGLLGEAATHASHWSGWSLLSLAPESGVFLHGLCASLVLASVALLIGFFPRIAAVIVYAIVTSLQHRNPYILNSGDRLLGMLAGLSALLPLANRFSVHALLRAKKGFPNRTPVASFGQRLVQLQIAYVYWFAFFSKIRQPRWLEGMALRDVLASPVVAEWPTYVDAPWVWALTYLTLLFEIAFPLLVWFRRFRMPILLSGLAFHTGIELTMTIPLFSAVMVSSYPVFLTDREVSVWGGRAWQLASRPFTRAR